MGQTKVMSLVEALINTMVGFMVSVLAQYAIFPLFGVYISFSQHILMGGLFTIVSILRSYYIRRLFNYLQLKTN